MGGWGVVHSTGGGVASGHTALNQRNGSPSERGGGGVVGASNAGPTPSSMIYVRDPSVGLAQRWVERKQGIHLGVVQEGGTPLDAPGHVEDNNVT